MNIWYILLIALGSILVLYLIVAAILMALMKRAQRRAFKALDALVPYEKKRMEIVLDCRDTLEDDHYHLAQNIKEVIDEAQDLINQSRIDMGKVKGENDFLIMYFQKYLKEKRLLHDEKYKKLSDELGAEIHLDPAEKSSPYKKYDDLAFRYNAYLGMMILAPFLGGKKNPQAPVL
jgi:hypothetical protein